jgi:hypothetical protein
MVARCQNGELVGDSVRNGRGLCVADVRRERRRRMTNEKEGLFDIGKFKVARSDIPAVTYVDYSARVQTIHADTNPQFHARVLRCESKPDDRCGLGPDHQPRRFRVLDDPRIDRAGLVICPA